MGRSKRKREGQTVGSKPPVLPLFYDNVMHCTFADLGSNKVSSSSSSAVTILSNLEPLAIPIRGSLLHVLCKLIKTTNLHRLDLAL